MRTAMVLFAFLFACGGSSAPAQAPMAEPGAPEGTEPESAAVDPSASEGVVSDEAAARTPVDQAVFLFEQMVEVVTNAGADCDKIAADLSAWADSTAEQRTRLNDELNDSGKVEEVQARVMERPELVQSLQNALQPCQGNQAVMEALTKASGA